jgi:hypothetical protein
MLLFVVELGLHIVVAANGVVVTRRPPPPGGHPPPPRRGAPPARLDTRRTPEAVTAVAIPRFPRQRPYYLVPPTLPSQTPEQPLFKSPNFL